MLSPFHSDRKQGQGEDKMNNVNTESMNHSLNKDRNYAGFCFSFVLAINDDVWGAIFRFIAEYLIYCVNSIYLDEILKTRDVYSKPSQESQYLLQES
jgi:hypothetical protein